MTPKERFIESGLAKKMESALASSEMRAACDYALLQFHETLPPGNDAQTALSNAYGAAAAHRFVSILLNLATPKVDPKPIPTGNLNHKM